VRLAHLDEDNAIRRRLAANYDRPLAKAGFRTPEARGDHVYHVYVIRHPKRDAVRRWLQEKGVQTAVHYPVPVHLQPAYRRLGYPPGSLPVTEQAAGEILSLPLFPEMTAQQQETVIQALEEFARAGG
jgi:dTDP-4-amino-4,6-dideoxygalactose transaminase